MNIHLIYDQSNMKEIILSLSYLTFYTMHPKTTALNVFTSVSVGNPDPLSPSSKVR